jgi:Kelch motif
LPGGKREWEFYSTDANAFLEIGSFRSRTLRPRVLTLAASNAPVAALPGRLYAVGGRIDGNYSRKLASNEADDPPTNRWDQRAPLPTARPPLDLGGSDATNRGAPLHAILTAPAPSQQRAKQGKTIWFRAVPYLLGTVSIRRVLR